TAAADLSSDGLPQLGISRGRTVVRPSRMEGVNSSLNDIGRGREIGLADFQVNNIFALPLQIPSPVQNFKCGFRSQPGHPLRQPQFELDRACHLAKALILLLREEGFHEGAQCRAMVTMAWPNPSEFPERLPEIRLG